MLNIHGAIPGTKPSAPDCKADVLPLHSPMAPGVLFLIDILIFKNSALKIEPSQFCNSLL